MPVPGRSFRKPDSIVSRASRGKSRSFGGRVPEPPIWEGGGREASRRRSKHHTRRGITIPPPSQSGGFATRSPKCFARNGCDAGAGMGPRIRGNGVATSLHALVADLLDGGAVAGFAAGVLDAERGAVLATGLVLVINRGAGRCDGRGAVAEVEDVFDDRVAEL